jgi:hypothetical protein
MTVSAPPATLETWLAYARLGIPIVPEHTPDPITATGCDCRKDDCTKPGKHPRTLNGSDDATTDEAAITRWHRMFPHANVGTSLEMASLVIIGPDSPEWHEEFKRRGLPPGPVARSGGGEGHLHYYYRRPEGVPATRICKSDEYDLLAKGNAILSPSLHASGRRYEWIVPITSLDAIPYLPEWACAELRAAGAKRERLEITRDDDDGPPIELDDFALQVYRGGLPKLHKDGRVDRNASLMKIGRVLYDAGATRRLLVDELAERDAALYQKFTGRKDAGARYHAIVDELERTGRNGRRGPDVTFDDEPAVDSGSGAKMARETGSDGASTCDGNCPTAVALREQCAEYKADRDLLRAGAVPAAEGMGLSQLVTIAASALSRGERVENIFVPDVANLAGVGTKTMTRVLNQVRRWQANPDLEASLPFTVNDYKVGGKDRVRLLIRPPTDDEQTRRPRLPMLRALIRMPRDVERKQHGGDHRCPKHPDAPILRTTQWRCTEDGCGWIEQDSAILGRGRDQDGSGRVGDVDEIHGAPFVTVQAAGAHVPGQDGPLGVDTNPGQDGPGPQKPISFVTADDAALFATPRLHLVEAGPEPPSARPKPWRCHCGSYERYPRSTGGYRCDGCGDVMMPAVSGGSE